MTGKDVWRWILTKFDNDILHHIYDKKKVVCKGFRTNTIKDIGTNRNRCITNLINKDNYKKLIMWSGESPPIQLDGISLEDKELNELVEIATEKGIVNVLIKLFCENQEKVAIQLFAFLQDEKSSLLDIPNQAIGITAEDKPRPEVGEAEQAETTEKTETRNLVHEEVVIKTEGKKIQKLSKKVENLTEELKKRDILHKSKAEEMERNHQSTIQKLNDKNQLYSALLKERESLTKEFQDEKKKWENEISDYKNKIASLEDEVKALREKIIAQTNVKATKEKDSPKEIVRIQVIGKPHYTTHFQIENVEFSFIEGNDVHDFTFEDTFDAYWVLSYELSNREQLLLKVNNSYEKLECEKVYICKDFIDVRKQLNKFNREEERVI